MSKIMLFMVREVVHEARRAYNSESRFASLDEDRGKRKCQ